MKNNKETSPAWLDRPLPRSNSSLSVDVIIFISIILFACVSRFIALGDRPLSHDESVHIYYSYLFSMGSGYFHTPLSHGPLQFHLIALLFKLFGSSDFIGRIPHALASILTIIMIWKWRNYLGRAGTIISALLLLISPYMLYYGRYARNESFVVLLGVLTLYAILRYLETGRNRYLFLLTTVTALHFTVKETSFIYTAQALIFLFIKFLFDISRIAWKNKKYLRICFAFLVVGIILVIIALGLGLYKGGIRELDSTNTSLPAIPELDLRTLSDETSENYSTLGIISVLLGGLGGISLIISSILAVFGLGWKNIRQQRAFDMLVLLGTFVLPQLTAFPVTWLGMNPLDYHFNWPGWDFSAIFDQTPAKIAVVFLGLSLVSVILGAIWDKQRWFSQALLFWSIYILFFTTLFSNPAGFFTGSVGSLGYWLEQQSVHRGNQPWFYYVFIQIPMYEFLPALSLLPASFYGFRAVLQKTIQKPPNHNQSPTNHEALLFVLLLFWTITGLLAYTAAGEKMPWLTAHITMPMLLLGGWGLGKLVEHIEWSQLRLNHGILVGILLITTAVALGEISTSALGLPPSFHGKEQETLMPTARFLTWLLMGLICGIGVSITTRGWGRGNVFRFSTLILFFTLAVITIRISFRATFINGGNAYEYLVYAHGATGIKNAEFQINKISRRFSSGYNNLMIRFDAGGETQGVSWPWKWYMRNYPGAQPYFIADENLLNSIVIVADPQSYEVVDTLTGDDYIYLDTLRMVWPNQDYFSLSWEDFTPFIIDPQFRAAIFYVWFNHDYSLYEQVTNKTNLSIPDWIPGDRMRIYIRKSAVIYDWDYNLLIVR